jgi:hypothetical protein
VTCVSIIDIQVINGMTRIKILIFRISPSSIITISTVASYYYGMQFGHTPKSTRQIIDCLLRCIFHFGRCSNNGQNYHHSKKSDHDNSNIVDQAIFSAIRKVTERIMSWKSQGLFLRK